ncbi:MAG: hypothetical protein ACI861_000599 [Paracoccaceae bacterium]|jgi:hypothetical protein
MQFSADGFRVIFKTAPSLVKTLAGTAPNARYDMIEGAGHFRCI